MLDIEPHLWYIIVVVSEWGEIVSGMKIGDLVKIGTASHAEIGIYLGEKTFDDNYTCSMVFFPQRAAQKNGGRNPTPVQTDILEVISETR